MKSLKIIGHYKNHRLQLPLFVVPGCATSRLFVSLLPGTCSYYYYVPLPGTWYLVFLVKIQLSRTSTVHQLVCKANTVPYSHSYQQHVITVRRHFCTSLSDIQELSKMCSNIYAAWLVHSRNSEDRSRFVPVFAFNTGR